MKQSITIGTKTAEMDEHGEITIHAGGEKVTASYRRVEVLWAMLAEAMSSVASLSRQNRMVEVENQRISKLGVGQYKRFPDGRLKPFLEESRYNELRDDDRFLYNCGPKPEGLV